MRFKMLTLPMMMTAALVLGGCGGEDEAPVAADSPAAPTAADVVAPPQAPTIAAPFELPGDATAGGSCALDQINGAPANGAVVQSGTQVVFAGWAVDAARQAPATPRLILRSDGGSYSIPMTTDGPRPDVVAALGPDTALASGYNLSSELQGVQAGTYSPAILVSEAPAVICELGVSLVVED